MRVQGTSGQVLLLSGRTPKRGWRNLGLVLPALRYASAAQHRAAFIVSIQLNSRDPRRQPGFMPQVVPDSESGPSESNDDEWDDDWDDDDAHGRDVPQRRRDS